MSFYFCSYFGIFVEMFSPRFAEQLNSREHVYISYFNIHIHLFGILYFLFQVLIYPTMFETIYFLHVYPIYHIFPDVLGVDRCVFPWEGAAKGVYQAVHQITPRIHVIWFDTIFIPSLSNHTI